MRLSLKIEELAVKGFLLFSVLVVFGSLFSILSYILYQGIGHVTLEFLLSSPENMGRAGGIFPAIIGTICLVGLGLVVAGPLGILGATYMTEYARPGPFVRTVRFGVDVLAGIPSIVFGLFGFAFLVIFCGFGWSILSGGLTLAFMILPYTLKATEEAIKSVPRQYREASLSLGATRWQTVARVVLPAAMPGIFTGLMLALGKAVGETAAIMLTAGSSLMLPTSVMDPLRCLPLHLYILVTEGISEEKAYATACVLIILILIVNIAAIYLMNRMVAKRTGIRKTRKHRYSRLFTMFTKHLGLRKA
jgi:phosphate transport system permease protein